MVENFKEFYNSQPKKEKSSLFKNFFPNFLPLYNIKSTNILNYL